MGAVHPVTPRDALLARLEELRKRANAASPGPWKWERSPANALYLKAADGHDVLSDDMHLIYAVDRKYLPAHSPDLMAAVWAGLAEEVGPHDACSCVRPLIPQDVYDPPHCGFCSLHGKQEVRWPCPFIARWCRVLGVAGEPGRTPEVGT